MKDDLVEKFKKFGSNLICSSLEGKQYYLCLIELNFNEKAHKFLITMLQNDKNLDMSIKIKENMMNLFEQGHTKYNLKEFLINFFQNILINNE